MTITNGILNFAKVTDGVYRGGQPTDEGWAYLRELGVTNVVKLNLEMGDGDTGMVVEKCGIDFMHQLVGPVDRGTVQDALSAIGTNTFVHCEHGQDRTGLVVACYRYGTGWTKEGAELEMILNGFHKVLRGLWDFWEAYEL